MAAKWAHPQLGTFKYDDDDGAWVTQVKAPAFDAFRWENAPGGEYDLMIDGDDEDDVPSDAAVAVAQKVLAAQSQLPDKVTRALWDDFNGRGGDSGMWWHDALDEVAANCDAGDRPAPERPQDLLAMMDFLRIIVRKEVDGYEKPVAELAFSALFEEEHGVGVLTDGQTILGTGYIGEAAPFDSGDDDDDEEDEDDE